MKRARRVVRPRGLGRRGDTHELAAQLAPLEEQRPGESNEPAGDQGRVEVATQEIGAIVVGNQKPRIPNELVDVDAQKGVLGFAPVVLVVVALMLAYILFIGWQISRM